MLERRLDRMVARRCDNARIAVCNHSKGPASGARVDFPARGGIWNVGIPPAYTAQAVVEQCRYLRS